VIVTVFDAQTGREIPEARDFREKFSRIVQRERIRLRMAILVGAFGALFVVSMPFWQLPRTYLIAVGALGAGAMAGWALWIFLRRRWRFCPACEKRIELLGRHCPRCGSESLRPVARHPSEAWRCERCEQDFVPGLRRTYAIRYCSHCGGFLDNDGV